MLFPETNLAHDIATVQGYGPLWPSELRLLTGFKPWGSSEFIIELLRNPRLMRTLGVRYVAVRDAQELEALDVATWPTLETPESQMILESESPVPIGADGGQLFPVRIDEPGLYELTMHIHAPDRISTHRAFVRLETSEHEEIHKTRTLEPVDLSISRDMRFLYPVENPQAALPSRSTESPSRASPPCRRTAQSVTGTAIDRLTGFSVSCPTASCCTRCPTVSSCCTGRSRIQRRPTRRTPCGNWPTPRTGIKPPDMPSSR
jgi:hypothetical protein